jgi:hypothetical protein
MSTNYIQAIISRNRQQAEQNRQMLHGLKYNLAMLQARINGLSADIAKAEEDFAELTQTSILDAPVKTMSRTEMHLIAS